MYRGRPEQMRDRNWNQRVDATGGRLMYASSDGMAPHKLVRGELAGGDGAPRRQSRPPGVRLNKIKPSTEGQLLHQPQTSPAARLQLDMNNGELLSAREEPSVSDPAANGEASLVAPEKKRKASQKGKVKVTGKAVMLDEIINYVQSLQRQVEFLSLKLATVNPQLDFNNMPSFVPKDMHQVCGTMPSLVCSMETSEVSVAYISQPQQGNAIHYVFPNSMETQRGVDMLDTACHQNLSTHHHPFIAGFETASSQVGAFWEDDLQNVTHVGI